MTGTVRGSSCRGAVPTRKSSVRPHARSRPMGGMDAAVGGEEARVARVGVLRLIGGPLVLWMERVGRQSGAVALGDLDVAGLGAHLG